MTMTHDVITWLAIRTVAGFASAVLFVIAVDWMLDHARGRSAQLPGWGFGGVGVGIVLSGALMLLLPAAGGVPPGGRRRHSRPDGGDRLAHAGHG